MYEQLHLSEIPVIECNLECGNGKCYVLNNAPTCECYYESFPDKDGTNCEPFLIASDDWLPDNFLEDLTPGKKQFTTSATITSITEPKFISSDVISSELLCKTALVDCTNGTCNLKSGQPTCDCNENFTFDAVLKACISISMDTPICPLQCLDGRCIFDFMGDPICECDDGFILSELKYCLFDCPLDCANGECKFDFMGNPICFCNEGFALNKENKCEFICPLDCANGECVYDFTESPICSCNGGFSINEAGECEFICPLECVNGECKYDFMGSPTCLCDEGFLLNELKKCEFICPLECLNGKCQFEDIESSFCSCDEG